jgi:hypothetical protein
VYACGLCHGLDHAPRGSFDGTVEAGAEQRVDQHSGTREAGRARGFARASPGGRRQGGIALEPVGIA